MSTAQTLLGSGGTNKIRLISSVTSYNFSQLNWLLKTKLLTLIVAGFQVIGSGLGLLKYFLAAASSRKDSSLSGGIDSYVYGIALGCILLAGTLLRIPLLLLIWLLVIGMGLALVLFAFIVLVFATAARGEWSLIPDVIIGFLICLVMYCCLAVVSSRRREIIQEQSRMKDE